MEISPLQTSHLENCPLRHNWGETEILELFEQPFNDLLFSAHSLHRAYFEPNTVQLSTLLNIKSGGCPEDCAYCPQSARYDTQVEPEPILATETVLDAAQKAQNAGATRFCMGAAWRAPKDRDLEKVMDLIGEVKGLGMETCVTLGMLTRSQARRLKSAGLDYYNHNLDTSPEFYGEIISTRTYADRLNTIEHVREAGINVCCGGIIGLGENTKDRAAMLGVLANMPLHPESLPINMLIRVEGTPLAAADPVHPIDFVRTIAVSRVLMPRTVVRLSAGRTTMSDELQALCFFAGANSIFYGDQLLTTSNPLATNDRLLFDRLGLAAASG